MTEVRLTQARAEAGGAPPEPTSGWDAESAQWLAGLRSDAADRDAWIARLHALLLRAARKEAMRRRGSVPNLPWTVLEVAAQESADDAVMAVLERLDRFEGRSRFTTWAFKFAVLNTSVALRRMAWRDREIPVDIEEWSVVVDLQPGPQEVVETADLAGALRRAVATRLTPHQREVLVALTVSGVPIDVLADRLGTTRGALYKTLHDARSALRRTLSDAGYLGEEGPR